MNGASNLPGLYAIGEVGCTGLHGANRLASNSLLEGVVWRIGLARHWSASSRPSKTTKISLPEWESGDVQDVDELVVIYHNWDEIRRLMWDYVGIVRTDKRLQRAARVCGICSAKSANFTGISRSRSTCSNCGIWRRWRP